MLQPRNYKFRQKGSGSQERTFPYFKVSFLPQLCLKKVSWVTEAVNSFWKTVMLMIDVKANNWYFRRTY